MLTIVVVTDCLGLVIVSVFSKNTLSMPLSNPFRRTKKDKTGSIVAAAQSNNKPSVVPRLPPETSEAPKSQPNVSFLVQLAHGSPTETISEFSSVRQLYEKIAAAFKIPVDEILFCTTTTHKCDMSKLLGGQLVFGELLFCHVKGETKNVNVTKSEAAIGLTITDNGTGYAFIKRIRENSIADRCSSFLSGDHIAAINGASTVGCRHFQVAKMLKDIKVGSTFSMTLVEPRKAFDMISQRSAGKTPVSTENVGTGKATLRLRSKGPATIEALPSQDEEKAVQKIDDLLESFMGIRDLELSKTIWECGKEKKNPDEFVSTLADQLGDFGFPQEFIFDVWGIILDTRNKNAY